MTGDDGRFMLRALELARRGHGQVAPNPLVGAVVVRDGVVVGEGEAFPGMFLAINPGATSTYALHVHNAPRTALPPQTEALATMTPDEHRASPLHSVATLASPGAQAVRST